MDSMNQMMLRLMQFINKTTRKQRENLTIDMLQDRLSVNERQASSLIDLLIKEHVVKRKYTFACPKCDELNTVSESDTKSCECQICSAEIDVSSLLEGATVRYILDQNDFYEYMQEEYPEEYEAAQKGEFLMPQIEKCADSDNGSTRSYNYDIAVICALKEELDIVKGSLGNVSEISVPYDKYIYYEGTFETAGVTRRVVMAQSTQMGMVPASVLTTRMIYNFAPRYVVMTGIAAGISGKANFGDVIAAEYTWDYGAGKEAIDGETSVHRNTIEQISINPEVVTLIRRLSSDDAQMNKIKKEFNGTKPDTELKIVIGTVASGASVVADPKVAEKIVNDQIRDTVGVEMEIYGVYYAAKWAVTPKPRFLALKSVCDFADEKKDDRYHPYASYTSAKVFIELAKNYFDYDF